MSGEASSLHSTCKRENTRHATKCTYLRAAEGEGGREGGREREGEGEREREKRERSEM